MTTFGYINPENPNLLPIPGGDMLKDINARAYSRNPQDVMAAQITPDNIKEIAEWAKAPVRTTSTRGEYILLGTATRPVQVFAGDWVVKIGTEFKKFSDKNFKFTYSIAKAKLPTPADVFGKPEPLDNPKFYRKERDYSVEDLVDALIILSAFKETKVTPE